MHLMTVFEQPQDRVDAYKPGPAGDQNRAHDALRCNAAMARRLHPCAQKRIRPGESAFVPPKPPAFDRAAQSPLPGWLPATAFDPERKLGSSVWAASLGWKL